MPDCYRAARARRAARFQCAGEPRPPRTTKARRPLLVAIAPDKVSLCGRSRSAGFPFSGAAYHEGRPAFRGAPTSTRGRDRRRIRSYFRLSSFWGLGPAPGPLPLFIIPSNRVLKAFDREKIGGKNTCNLDTNPPRTGHVSTARIKRFVSNSSEFPVP